MGDLVIEQIDILHTISRFFYGIKAECPGQYDDIQAIAKVSLKMVGPNQKV